jgi:hypothetical protein
VGLFDIAFRWSIKPGGLARESRSYDLNDLTDDADNAGR